MRIVKFDQHVSCMCVEVCVCVCVCEVVWGFVCVCSVWKYLVGYSSQKKISQIVFLHQDTPSQPFIYSRIRLSSIASTPNSICRIRTSSRPFLKVMFSIVIPNKTDFNLLIFHNNIRGKLSIMLFIQICACMLSLHPCKVWYSLAGIFDIFQYLYSQHKSWFQKQHFYLTITAHYQSSVGS